MHGAGPKDTTQEIDISAHINTSDVDTNLIVFLDIKRKFVVI